MISKQEQKYVQSLHNKKYRKEFGEFLVEGEKSILELLESNYEIVKIYATEKLAEKITFRNIVIDKEEKIEQISTFKSNNSGVAVVKQKLDVVFQFDINKNHLLLDGIADPGNLGTIIRLADWYGLEEIICSEDCAEFYNPKVISSTMGSFARITPHYFNLNQWLDDYPIYTIGATLGGQDLHSYTPESSFALIIGSESAGIREPLSKLIKKNLTIPRKGKAESLNAANATAIFLDRLF
ncbi:MAG: TrmH family RNA methyltransferase [Leadbetterella sp.]